MKREEYKQNIYTDEMDGPSPMQVLGNEKAFKDKYQDKKTCFENDRESHLGAIRDKINILDNAKGELYGTLLDKKNQPDRNGVSLKSPK